VQQRRPSGQQQLSGCRRHRWQLSLFYSGDDADAKAAVRRLMEKAGFFPIDLGPAGVVSLVKI